MFAGVIFVPAHKLFLEPMKNAHFLAVTKALKTVWQKRPSVMLACRFMLILDSLSGHTTEDAKNRLSRPGTDLEV